MCVCVGETMAGFGTGMIGKVRKAVGTAGLCMWSRVLGVRGWTDRIGRRPALSLYKNFPKGKKNDGKICSWIPVRAPVWDSVLRYIHVYYYYHFFLSFSMPPFPFAGASVGKGGR